MISGLWESLCCFCEGKTEYGDAMANRLVSQIHSYSSDFDSHWVIVTQSELSKLLGRATNWPYSKFYVELFRFIYSLTCRQTSHLQTIPSHLRTINFNGNPPY